MEPQPLMFSEMQVGDRVNGLACLWSSELRRTRQGKPFLQVTLRDVEGMVVNGVMWDADPDNTPECPLVVRIDGDLGQYRGDPQVRVNAMHFTREDISPYLPTSYRPADELIDEFRGIIDLIEDDDLRALTLACLDAKPGFWTAPAAIGFHGAYRGGLLEHTLHVVRICLHAADIYAGRVNRDLLIAAAALHDIGKADAYDSPESRQPTQDERMVGHIVRGAMHIERTANGIEYKGEIPLADLLHPVISHHGELEFGAPVLPGTAEALILSGADTLDADVTGYFDLWREKSPNEGWTYSRQGQRWVRRPVDE